jgi:hypothetical protein
METLREADQRVKRYLPGGGKEVFIERMVKRICGKEQVGVGQLRLGTRGRGFPECGAR